MKLINRLVRQIAIASFALSLVACSSGIALTKEKVDTIEKVTVSPNVTGKGQISFNGNSAGMTALFGVLGAIAGSSMDADDQTRLNQFMAKQNLDIKKTVQEEFSKQLANTPMFSNKVVDQASDNTFRLEISHFSLSQTPALEYRPSLRIDGTLEDKQGTVIWQNNAVITAFNSDIPSHSFEEFFEGDNLKEGLQVLTKLVVAELTADFGAQPEEQ